MNPTVEVMRDLIRKLEPLLNEIEKKPEPTVTITRSQLEEAWDEHITFGYAPARESSAFALIAKRLGFEE